MNTGKNVDCIIHIAVMNSIFGPGRIYLFIFLETGENPDGARAAPSVQREQGKIQWSRTHGVIAVIRDS